MTDGSWISGVVDASTNNKDITRFFPCQIPLYLQAAAVGTTSYLAWAKGRLLKKGTRLNLQSDHPGIPVYWAGRTRGASNCTFLSRLHWGAWNLPSNQISGLKALSKWSLSGIRPEGFAWSSLLLQCDCWCLVCWILLSPALGSVQSSFCCWAEARGGDGSSFGAASLRGFVAYITAAIW